MYGTIQVKLTVSDAVMAYLVYQCHQANNLINSTLFHIRQAHFNSCPRKAFFDEDGMFRTAFELKAVKASYPEREQADEAECLLRGSGRTMRTAKA